MRILVLRGGALGDFLVTLPALQLLRERWPDAHIELAGNRYAAELAVRSRLIDVASSQHEARWAQLYSPAPLSAEFGAWLGGFDLVLSFWPDPDRTLGRHFPTRPGQTFLSGPALPVLAPAARHYCEPLRSLGLLARDFRGRLAVKAEPEGTVVLHPGSGSPTKNWPLTRWAALAEKLRTRASLIIVGSEPEAPALEVLSSTGEIFFQQPLHDLAVRLAGATLFVGHDSGVSHLAAAVGTPCVLLFGPTDPAMWAPPGEQIHVLRKGPDITAIGVDDVLKAIDAI